MLGLKSLFSRFLISAIVVCIIHVIAHYVFKFEQLTITQLFIASIMITGIISINSQKPKN